MKILNCLFPIHQIVKEENLKRIFKFSSHLFFKLFLSEIDLRIIPDIQASAKAFYRSIASDQ